MLWSRANYLSLLLLQELTLLQLSSSFFTLLLLAITRSVCFSTTFVVYSYLFYFVVFKELRRLNPHGHGGGEGRSNYLLS